MDEIEKIWDNDLSFLSLLKKNYFAKCDLYKFYIYLLLFISLIIFSILIVQKTFFSLFIVVITLSCIIAYNFAKTAIVLTIFLGQVVQFELAEVLGISIEKMSFGYFTIRLSDPLIFGMTITILLKGFTQIKSIIKFIKNDGLFFTLFFSIIIFQILRNVNLYGINSLGEFRTYYQFLIFIPYLVISINKSNDRRTVFFLLLGLSLSHIIFGAINGGVLYFFKFEEYNKWLSNYGSLSLIYGMIALFLIKRTECFNFKKTFTSIIFLIGITIIVVSSSRSAWLAGVAGLIILIIFGQFKLNNLFNLLLLSFIVFYLLVMLFEYSGIDMFIFFEKRLTAFFEYENDPTASWRYFFWLSTFEKIKNNIILGHGLGQHFQIYIPEFKETITTSPHNLYLTILFHTGILGTAFYLLFIVKAFIDMKKSLRNIRERYIILNSIVVLFIVHFYGIAYSFEKDFFTWMYIGLGISAIFNRKKEIYEEKNYHKIINVMPSFNQGKFKENNIKSVINTK